MRMHMQAPTYKHNNTRMLARTHLFLIASPLRPAQHTATHCTTHCNTLQHTATHCNTLQHTATHCSTLQRTATHCYTPVAHGFAFEIGGKVGREILKFVQLFTCIHTQNRSIRIYTQSRPEILKFIQFCTYIQASRAHTITILKVAYTKSRN